MLGDAACEYHVIVGDGNCLFAATAHQLFGYNISSTMHNAMTTALREMVVDYINENANDPEIQFAVITRMQDEFPALLSRQPLTSIHNFTRLLAQSGVWGAPESCLSIARIFQVDLIILREGASSILINCGPSPAAQTIRIVYTGPLNAWNHYSSFKRFDALSTPRLPTTNRIPSHTRLIATNGGFCSVNVIAPDGNCLFAAVAHQLFPTSNTDPIIRQHATKIRFLTVQYLAEHTQDPTIRNLMYERIMMDFPHFITQNPNAPLPMLLDKLSQPGVWGGTESLTAIARFFNVQL